MEIHSDLNCLLHLSKAFCIVTKDRNYSIILSSLDDFLPSDSGEWSRSQSLCSMLFSKKYLCFIVGISNSRSLCMHQIGDSLFHLSSNAVSQSEGRSSSNISRHSPGSSKYLSSRTEGFAVISPTQTLEQHSGRSIQNGCTSNKSETYRIKIVPHSKGPSPPSPLSSSILVVQLPQPCI